MASYLKQSNACPGLPNQKPRFYDSQAGANSGIISASPCYVVQANILTVAASGVLYFMLFDSATVPSNGAVPLFAPVKLTGGASANVPFQPSVGTGQYIAAYLTANGLSWAASSTPGTLTVDGTSSLWPTIIIF